LKRSYFLNGGYKGTKANLNKFSPFATRIAGHLTTLSTAGFTIAVAEEFLVLSVITYLAVICEYYELWYAAFAAYSLHLISHFVQCFIFKSYVPGVVTAALSLIYCVYAYHTEQTSLSFGWNEQLVLTLTGVVTMILNLAGALKLGFIVDRWMKG
jgi:hypothetical protein